MDISGHTGLSESRAMDQAVDFLTPKEVASRLKVSERTVRRWIGERKLAGRRFGRQLRISSAAVDAFGGGPGPDEHDRDWAALALDSFAKDCENERDAEYDRWREHDSVREG